MSTLAKREVTVEEALAELRDMFPGATNTIIIKDERFSRRVSVKVGYRIAEYDNLDDCMTVVRKWHKEQSSESKEQQPQIRNPPYTVDPGERESDGSDCWWINSEEGSVAEMICPTVRAEERKAAFSNAIRIARDFRRKHHDDLYRDYGTLSLVEALERAALTEK